MRLFLIRHPRPEVAVGFCYGRTDLALREPWSHAAAAGLIGEARIVSSPLRRCSEFAAALSPDYRIDPRLTELDFGEWEMRAWDAIPRDGLDAWAADPSGFCAHGGESIARLRMRVRQALADLDGDDYAWVTHAGVIRLTFAELLHLPQKEWLNLHFDYAGVSAIEIENGVARLLLGNRGV